MRTDRVDPAGRQTLVLTPSRLRIDSRILIAHTTAQWLTNAVWALCILLKLTGTSSASWWIIWIPTWINHALHIPLQILVVAYTNALIYRQIGPPPPETASVGLHIQYGEVAQTRKRSHIIDGVNSLIETIAMLVAKVLFCRGLEAGNLGSLRIIFIPFWVSWAVCTLLDCQKDRSERVLGSTRDLLYLFLLFVALKVDGTLDISWRVAFLVPWIWFCGLFLLAWVLLTLLMFARVWARITELLLPIGFLLLLLSTVPQFVSFLFLVSYLDFPDDTSKPSMAAIIVPNAVSWLCMWLSSLLLAYGLHQKELVRDALLASGAVWTMHEQVARRLRLQDQDELRRKIDNLSDDEIGKLVQEMMTGLSLIHI